jgi:hypothetical protein
LKREGGELEHAFARKGAGDAKKKEVYIPRNSAFNILGW